MTSRKPDRGSKMESLKLKIGLLGLGFAAAGHIPVYKARPDVEVAALGIMDFETARGEEIAHRFGIPKILTDFDQLVTSPEIDVVSIVVPPFLHFPLASKALKAGKHVLCEKPMALNITEAKEMFRLAEEKKKIGMVDFEHRFFPSRQKMKELIGSGYLGKIFSVNLSMFFDYNANPVIKAWNWLSQKEKGGGILGAVGCHYIDMLLWMFGDITEIDGRLDTFVQKRFLPGSKEAREVETDDTFAFLCKFSSGALGAAHFCSVANQGIGIRSGVGVAKIEVYGSEGTLILDADDKLWGAQGGKKELKEIPIDRLSYSEVEPIFSQRQRRGLEGVVDEMIRGIREGKQRSPSFIDGVRCQEVMDAIHISHVKKSWISLPL
jgi:predicted dehydrogenase